MSDYFMDSMCYSAFGFILGYLVCKVEVQLRERWHRDHS